MRYNTEGWNALLAMLSTGAILGHNLWLLASRKNGARLRLEMNTSDLFPMSESAISPERVAELSLISTRGVLPVKDFQAEGTSLVAEVNALESEVLLAALTLHPREITLGAEKFEHYLAEEDARDAIAIRQQTRQSGVDGREIYTKYAKAVFQTEAQPDEAFGQVVGHRLEIVPERNPCALRIGDRLSVQVLFNGAPVVGLRVSGGGEQLENGRYASHARTDKTGRAEIEIIGAGRCFVRTHLIRPHVETKAADWESFWASLTFTVNA